MYNSQNLPLSKKKIIKKTINSVGILPMILLLVLFPIVSFMGSSLDFHIGNKAALIAFLVLFVPSLIILLIALGWQYLYYKYYYYNFEMDGAEIKKGVISNATGHVRYGKIQNIFVDQDFLDRVFGLYDVHYETAGESSDFYSHVDGLEKENADKLVKFLNERVQNKGYQNPQTTSIAVEKEVEGATINENDQRVLTRENMPIEKKIIFADVVVRTIFYSVVLIIGLGYIGNAVSDALKLPLSVFGYGIVVIPILTLIVSYVMELIWYKNYYFKFDSQGGIITEKVLSARTTHVYFNRVQNIDISQSIVERFLGLYEVTMETAAESTGDGSITVTGLKKENAEILRDFLLQKTKKYQSA
ncbi:MAG: PH domain-containing protein [Candidatus Moraniibacteriota bacterium]|nr:MAG: PH domain-containing protein [Candidatus Moranbacteria bacterium]